MNALLVGATIVAILVALDYRNKWIEGKNENKRVKEIHDKFRKDIEEKKKK